MRFATRLVLLFGGVLALAMLGMFLALWADREARYNLERTDLAHRSYEAHLSLSSHTYQLFKQFGDAMIIGDQDRGALEADLLAAIRRDIAEIRQIIAGEIRLVGEQEAEELERLSRIETHINDLLREYQRVLNTGYAIPFQDEWTRLSRILDQRVDQDFARLTQQALDEERSELEAQQATTLQRLQLNQGLALAAALVGFVAAIAASWRLLTDLRTPVSRLVEGAEALARGNLDFRIAIEGGSELAGVARAFNRMAAEIVSREQALQSTNQRLEQAVAERTAELERLLDTLKRAEADRIRLLADVSHELRTPLTIIRGEADIALRGGEKSPAEYRLALEKSREAAKHTARLVDDLLFIARRESGKARLAIGEIDLATLLPQVVADCRTLATDCQSSIELHNPLARAVVRADVDRLRQVLLILLDNALRYGGGAVRVRLDAGPASLSVTVSDQGPGLSSEDLARAFQRFYRGSNAGRLYRQGSGLGLPVAKAIIEAHGGEIAMDSQPGEGVTVRFSLPIRPRLEVVS